MLTHASHFSNAVRERKKLHTATVLVPARIEVCPRPIIPGVYPVSDSGSVLGYIAKIRNVSEAKSLGVFTDLAKLSINHQRT